MLKIDSLVVLLSYRQSVCEMRQFSRHALMQVLCEMRHLSRHALMQVLCEMRHLSRHALRQAVIVLKKTPQSSCSQAGSHCVKKDTSVVMLSRSNQCAKKKGHIIVLKKKTKQNISVVMLSCRQSVCYIRHCGHMLSCRRLFW